MGEDKLVKSAAKSFTRLARYIDQLARENLSCGPVTVQQCYALEALTGGPLNMKDLASRVGVHQSTLTRIIEKLENHKYVVRSRKSGNQRAVEVELTESGGRLCEYLADENYKMVAGMLAMIPKNKRKEVVGAMETLTGILSPDNPEFVSLMKNCCSEMRGEKEGDK